MFDVKYTLLTILVIILIVLSFVVYFTLPERESFQNNTEESTNVANNVPTEASTNVANNVPTEANNVPTESNNVPTEANNVPTEANNVPTVANNVVNGAIVANNLLGNNNLNTNVVNTTKGLPSTTTGLPSTTTVATTVASTVAPGPINNILKVKFDSNIELSEDEFYINKLAIETELIKKLMTELNISPAEFTLEVYQGSIMAII